METTDELFDEVIGVNLKGVFLVTQVALRALIENVSTIDLSSVNSYASIIQLASIAGLLGLPNGSHYSASKAGVEGLSRAVAKEVGQYKIRVNCILPSYVRTPMTQNYIDMPGVVERLEKRTVLGRIGEPKDVASLAVFLASDDSSYMTGNSIRVDGGFS